MKMLRPGEYGATVLGDEATPVLDGGPVEPGGLGRLHVGEVTGAVHRHAAEHVEPTHTVYRVFIHTSRIQGVSIKQTRIKLIIVAWRGDAFLHCQQVRENGHEEPNIMLIWLKHSTFYLLL